MLLPSFSAVDGLIVYQVTWWVVEDPWWPFQWSVGPCAKWSSARPCTTAPSSWMSISMARFRGWSCWRADAAECAFSDFFFEPSKSEVANVCGYVKDVVTRVRFPMFGFHVCFHVPLPFSGAPRARIHCQVSYHTDTSAEGSISLSGIIFSAPSDGKRFLPTVGAWYSETLLKYWELLGDVMRCPWSCRPMLINLIFRVRPKDNPFTTIYHMSFVKYLFLLCLCMGMIQN